MNNDFKCLWEGCENLANGSRGLCRTHYNWLKPRVNRGEYVWADLERLGLSLPPRSNVQSKMKKQFDRLIEKRSESFGK